MARETIASVKQALTGELQELRARNQRQAEQIAKLEAELAGRDARRDARIETLLKANTDYLAAAREAKEQVLRLQGNLSDAARLIATLGARAEG